MRLTDFVADNRDGQINTCFYCRMGEENPIHHDEESNEARARLAVASRRGEE